jgi:hypothetical protein
MAGGDGRNLIAGSRGARPLTGAALARFILAESDMWRAGLVFEKYRPFLASVEKPARARRRMRTAVLVKHNFTVVGPGGQLRA